jgi:hypothetical protein
VSEHIWTDTPPKEPGFWYVLYKLHSEIMVGQLTPLGWVVAGGYWSRKELDELQFGPRIPSAEELAGMYEDKVLSDQFLVAAEIEANTPISVGPGLPSVTEAKVSWFEPMPYPLTHIEVPVDELDQLRAAAKELAEIKRAWGMGDTKGGA